MNNHLAAIFQVLIIYFLMGCSYYGWGQALIKTFAIQDEPIPTASTLIWLGWSSTLLLFQTLHLLFPLTATVIIPIATLGIVFSLKFHKNEYRVDLLTPLSTVKFIGKITILVTMSVWVASRAMLQPTNYDAGLYYFNSIRWINTFPLVLGLGNLHGRLAFNQSFFTYVAALNIYPLYNHGRSIANSFIFILTFATTYERVLPILKRPKTLIQAHPYKYLPVIFVFPILGFIALTSAMRGGGWPFLDGFASPSPDFASMLLQLVLFIYLSSDINDWLGGMNQQTSRAFVLAFLAVTLVTIKLSNLVFGVVLLLYILNYAWKSGLFDSRKIIRVFLLPSFAIIVWCLRGVFLSGSPLYPTMIGSLPVEWAVPKEDVINTVNSIYSWARTPQTHWSEVLGSWNWFKPWAQIFIETYFISAVYPLIVSIWIFISMLILRVTKKAPFPKALEWIIIIPIAFGLVYWFFSAPDPRFSNSLFLLLPVSLILLFLTSVRNRITKRVFFGILCICFVVGNLNYLYFVVANNPLHQEVSTSGYHPIKAVGLESNVTISGLEIYTPKTGDQCWDSPLPCTPYFNNNLASIKSGNLASGFLVKK